ncbi:hypothetical protein NEOLEDRAFT_1140630 [Neolentinus lepideus HHB14362 ss-1]|uniref:Uncharacterized protein n=1 Tax=Neolentinus lepideus HHB14362 ss-1 TaxID=1314782 RepID=A0A165P4U6_9AGAM|nr:hypothetical protein NEOLEDRAFT_1140630 [Neolentinus lepideus HHB14362 ss-1]
MDALKASSTPRPFPMPVPSKTFKSQPQTPKGLQSKTPKPPAKLNAIPTSQSMTMKVCSGCHKPRISPSDVFKTCQKCRDKERQKRIRRAVRAAAAASPTSGSTVTKMAPLKLPTDFGRIPLLEVKESSVAGFARLWQIEDEPEETQKALSGVKREANTDLSTTKKITKRPKLEFGASITKAPFNAPPHDDSIPTPYQSSTMLIRTIPALKAVAFTGVYSIIANPTTDHVRRAHKVYKELKREWKKSWAFSATGTVIDSKSFIYRAHFPCTCATAHSPPAVSLSSKSKAKTLVGYFSSSPSPPDAEQGKECTGYLRITVSDDCSHWLPIKGQKIVVQVEHP